MSAKRERAMDLLQKAQFPCLLPIDRETGKSHVLNDGFVVIDIETSGTDPRIHEITKLSAVWVADFRVEDRFETFVRIKRPMCHNAEELTGITNEMLKNAPCIEDALRWLVQWHPLDPIVFYDGDFTAGILYTALVKTGVAFDACRPRIDLMYLTARLYTAYSMEHSLKLSDTIGLLPEPSGYDDAELIAELLIFFLQKLQNEYGFHCVSDFFKLYPHEDAQ